MKVILILPKDITELKKKYSNMLAEAVCRRLTHEELGELIKRLEENKGNL